MLLDEDYGRVAEWFKAPVLKCVFGHQAVSAPVRLVVFRLVFRFVGRPLPVSDSGTTGRMFTTC
jgi:hypothetical protein